MFYGLKFFIFYFQYRSLFLAQSNLNWPSGQGHFDNYSTVFRGILAIPLGNFVQTSVRPQWQDYRNHALSMRNELNFFVY